MSHEGCIPLHIYILTLSSKISHTAIVIFIVLLTVWIIAITIIINSSVLTCNNYMVNPKSRCVTLWNESNNATVDT